MTAVAIDTLKLRQRQLQLRQRLATQGAQPQAEAPPERAPEAWYEDFGEGVGVSGLDTYYGIKDLVSELDDEDRATLKDWKEDAGQSGWGTAGRIVGELGQLALPGAAATKGLRGLAAGSKLIKSAKAAKALKAAAPIAGDVAATMVHGGLKLPGEGETRLQSAAQEGFGALAGGVLGKTLSKAARGLKRTPSAQKLLDEGVYLTPGQASQSKAIQAIENVMDITPIVARGTQTAQEKAGKAFAKHAIKEAAPEGVTITKIGNEGYDQLRGGVTDAYTKAWAKIGDIPETAVAKMLDQIDAVTPVLPIDDARVLKGVAENAIKLFDDASPAKAAKSFDNLLRRKLSSAAKSGKRELADELIALRSTFREGISPEAAKALAKVDAKYPAYLAIQKATAKAHKKRGVFTPDQLSEASKAVGGEAKTAGARSPLFESAAKGIETSGKVAGGGEIIGRLQRAMTLTPTPIPMQMIGNQLTGQGKYVQPAMRALMDSPLSKILRDYISPAKLGAAVEE